MCNYFETIDLEAQGTPFGTSPLETSIDMIVRKSYECQTQFDAFLSSFDSGFEPGRFDSFSGLSFSDRAFLNARMLFPNPSPSAGSFPGPNMISTINTIRIKCRGWKRP